jgi:hypothetical protein
MKTGVVSGQAALPHMENDILTSFPEQGGIAWHA